MKDIKIEKNVPIPRNKRGGSVSPWPLKNMQPGDSFFFEGDKYTVLKLRSHILYFRHKGTGSQTMKFSVLKVEGGYRCWRVK